MDKAKCWKVRETTETLVGMQEYTHSENSLAVSHKVKYSPTIQFSNSTPREMKTFFHKETHTLISDLFIITKTGNTLNVHQQMNRLKNAVYS